MSEKKKTLEFLTKQIALESIVIEKTEKLLEDLKKQRTKDMDAYERTTKASEKSMEQMIKGGKKDG
jgi:hypothetical protein